MKLKCVSRYSSHLGSWRPGEVFDAPDDIAGQIMRSSPESFEVVGSSVRVEAETPDLSAMSEETATGLVAPDRRARGGRVRVKRSKK